MSDGELDPRAKPEPTPDQRRQMSDKWKKLWDDIYAAIERDLLRHLDDDPGLPLGWEGIEPVEGDDVPRDNRRDPRGILSGSFDQGPQINKESLDSAWGHEAEDNYLDQLWAVRLIEESGCVPPS